MGIRSKALLAAFLACTTVLPAQAATNLDLGTYSVKLTKTLDPSGSGLLEASGMAYNSDRNSLMIIGDEARVMEYSLDGTPFPGRSAIFGVSSFNDPEGLTYIGNGQYILAEERTMRMWLINEVTDPADPGFLSFDQKNSGKFYALSPFNVGNIGLEGVAYDPLTKGYFAVKERGPQAVYFVDVDIQNPEGGSHVELFDTAGLGLNSLSDIAVVSGVSRFAGTAFAENLLILSASSQKLIEVNRKGDVLSSFDLANLTVPTGESISAIEGVVLDKDGNIYLAAEFGGPFGRSALIVLQRDPLAAVPEPASWAMMIAGFGIVGAAARRRVRQQPGIA